MRSINKLVVFTFLLACMMGGNSSSALKNDGSLSIKAASPQSASMMPFRAIKKLDADIQSCIDGKLKGGALKDDGISVKVNGGEAVLEGKSSVSGHKGAATNIAKGCGAQKVTNNIVITRNPKPPKT